MGYTRAEIISGVRKELDEIQLNSSGFATGTDNGDLDELIIHMLSEAVEFCYGHADLSMLSPTTVKTASNVTFLEIENYSSGPFIDNTNAYLKNYPGNTAYVGKVALGSSFIRLHGVSCASWEKDVTEPVYWNDEGAAKLRNWYTTGTPERPVVYITKDQSGYTAYLFIVNNSETITVATIDKPSMAPDQQGGYNIDSKLIGAVLTYTAGLVLTAIKDAHAESLFNKALIQMGAQKSESNG